ncbi:MAG: hypothetical protein ACE5I9_06210 [Candidatus Methylomirabilales bacterium]
MIGSRTRRVDGVFLLVALLAMPFAAYGQAQGARQAYPDPSSDFSISPSSSSVLLLAGTIWGDPNREVRVAEGESLPAGASRVTLTVKVVNPGGATAMAARWFRDGVFLLDYALPVNWGETVAEFSLASADGEPLPRGSYSVVLTSGQEVLGVRSFRVTDLPPVSLGLPSIPSSQPEAPRRASSKVTISMATLARGLQGGELVGVGTEFPNIIKQILLMVKATAHRDHLPLAARWVFLGPGGENPLLDYELILAAGESEVLYTLETEPGKAFPVGQYRVDLISGGEVLRSLQFRTGEAAIEEHIRGLAQEVEGLLKRIFED